MSHQPTLMHQQTTLSQNQLHSTLSPGGTTRPSTPVPLDRASMLQNQKANSYPRPALRVNTNAVQEHAGSEKSSLPKVQHDLVPLNPRQAPSNSEIRTAVSNWLDASLTFEKPPIPASIADSAPRQRRCKEYWLQVSQSLDFRIKSRPEQFKAPIHLNPGSVYANPSINSSTSNFQSQKRLPKPAKHAPPGQLNTFTNTVFPLLHNTMGSPKQQEPKRKCVIETNISEVIEKLEKHKGEQEKQEQLEAVKLNKVKEAVKAAAKKLEAAKSKKVDEAVEAKEKQEQLQTQKLRKADEAVKAKAKKLAADAMATHKNEQERKEYVEGRAHDIHESLLQCRPFDIDAVRREFSEKEVQDIKQNVRELGFAKQ